MEPMSAFLLAMQAAGLITSIFGAKTQDKFIKIGRKLEQEQYTTNLQAIKLQSAEDSLAEMKQLRQNIGSQIATQAAKGNRGGVSYAGINASSNAFESDERTRRLNLLAKESELRANHVLSGLHSLQSESQLGQALTKQFFDTFQTSTLLGPFGDKKKAAAGATNKWVDPDNFNWGY